jgi:transcriptional regulator with XRE-family HTH domain
MDTASSEIARQAGVTESWLKMFRRGKIPNPGIRDFQRIVDYLDRRVA